tara:strand:- start:1021 stop:1554 length:534 start_codon:yes stop_codon:yes gene_type:complete
MVNLYKYLFVILLLFSCKQINSSEISEAFDTIEIRKTAMQSLWHRVKRLSPYVELKEKVDYNKDLATDDAKEILTLIQKTRSLWSENSNLSAKGFTNATPAVWALPNYFEKLYTSAEKSAFNLKNAIINDDIDETVVAMCNLGKSCGTCHANFRRLLTSQLSNEVSGWSGKYINNCK